MSFLTSIGLSLLFPAVILVVLGFVIKYLHDRLLEKTPILDNHRSTTQGFAMLITLIIWFFPLNAGFYGFFRSFF